MVASDVGVNLIWALFPLPLCSKTWLRFTISVAFTLELSLCLAKDSDFGIVCAFRGSHCHHSSHLLYVTLFDTVALLYSCLCCFQFPELPLE